MEPQEQPGKTPWRQVMDAYLLNEKIFGELRKTNLLLLLGLLIFLVLVAEISYFIVLPNYLGKMRANRSAAQQAASFSWIRVNDLIDHGSYGEAEKIGLGLLKKTPEDFYANRVLAKLYLRKGDVAQALKYAETAYRLFPNKKNEETLQALKTRLASQPPKESTPPQQGAPAPPLPPKGR